MRRGDNARLIIREEHRGAIRSEDPEQQVRPVGDHRVGMGPRVLSPAARDISDLGGMDLVDGREFCIAQERGDREATVLLDCGPVVFASVSDIETG